MDFLPAGNRVLVELDEVTTSSSGKLYIPQTASAGPKTGKVVVVSSPYFVGGARVESVFKPNQKVLVDELGGLKLTIHNKEYLVLRNEDIIGIFSE